MCFFALKLRRTAQDDRDNLFIEKKLKGWSRKKKKAFVSGDFEILKALYSGLPRALRAMTFL